MTSLTDSDDSTQGLLSMNDKIRAAENRLGTKFEDMSLEDQASAIDGPEGIVTVIDPTSGPISGESTQFDNPASLKQKMVGGAAEMLNYANDGVTNLVNILGGEDNAAFAVFGIQSLVGGVPKGGPAGKSVGISHFVNKVLIRKAILIQA